MIQLDYQGDNPRWGKSGIAFSGWGQYAHTLGYLANIIHYRNSPAFKPIMGKWDKKIEVHIEDNEKQGAWGKEGRIQYYGMKNDMKLEFPDLYKCKSAGNDGISLRFNSNEYIYSLVNDLHFSRSKTPGRTTADIFPPFTEPYDRVWGILEMHLQELGMSDMQLHEVKDCFKRGWNK